MAAQQLPNGLDDVTWDGSSAIARAGSTKVAFLSFERPKVETKTEKVLRLGEQMASKRTPGKVEVGDASAEMLLTDWYSTWLPRMPRHGGTLLEFPVTMNRRHPAVAGNASYSFVCQQCRIVGQEEKIENGEKPATMKLMLSVMAVWEKGGDGIWKCMARIPSLPDSATQALMQF